MTAPPDSSDPGEPEPPATSKPPPEVTVPTTPETTPSSGPVAPRDRVEAAIADLSKRIDAKAADVAVAVDEAVDWKDGSIGCPRKGTMYPMVVTPGYRLILEVNGKQYAYHATRDQPFFYCATPDPRGALPGDGGMSS